MDAKRLETLHALAVTDLATVLANPVWNRLRKRDPNFLARTAPTFRLQLLRHYYKTHRKNPWGRLERAHEGDLRWPSWKAPIWTLLKHVERHPADEDVIRSPRFPLEHAWSIAFCATPAGGAFDHENGPVTARYGLNELLTAFFSHPDGNPRDVLSGWDLCLDLNSPDPIRYSGVELFQHAQSVDKLFADGDKPDSAAIASLCRPRNGVYTRALLPAEDPRPFFAKLPIVANSRRYEGEIRCRWKTTVFYPIEPAPEDHRVWRYERSQLDLGATLRGASLEDLADVSWKYNTMRDLQKLIERQIASSKAHQLLEPIYSWVLFRK